MMGAVYLAEVGMDSDPSYYYHSFRFRLFSFRMAYRGGYEKGGKIKTVFH